MMRNMACQITDLLSHKKMTQKELALKTGITESSISHYVKGNREPRGANLTKIAEALGTTTDYLLRNESDSIGYNNDLYEVKMLIARNASKMTKDERLDLIQMLMKEY